MRQKFQSRKSGLLKAQRHGYLAVIRFGKRDLKDLEAAKRERFSISKLAAKRRQKNVQFNSAP